MKAPDFIEIIRAGYVLGWTMRMPGSAKGYGAAIGNQNALKHGMYTREFLELQAHVRELLREGKKIIEKF
jgi:hypothetical protein